MDERRKKAFELATETVKQLITLSTGIIALTITFSKDLLEAVPAAAKPFLTFGWLAYLACVVFGVWALMALTGSLEPQPGNGDEEVLELPSIRRANVTLPAALQVLSFLAATVLIVVFGMKAWS